MLRVPVVVAVALAGLAWAGAVPARPAPAPAAKLATRVRAAHRAHPDHPGRLEAVSRLFVGAPFARSPLGEGPGQLPDPDPIMDLGRFDCLTFVEQVMALAWHADLNDASRELQRIRYTGGTIRYGARKHIMMAQWIPQNVAAGFVVDVTREVGGSETETAQLTIRRGDFDHGLGRQLVLDPQDRPVGAYALPVVAPSSLAQRIERVPHGTILTTIRRARPGVPYRASHVGLVLVVAGERRIRHADRRAGAVVDEPLARFLARAERLHSPPVAGFHLLAVASAAPSPR